MTEPAGQSRTGRSTSRDDYADVPAQLARLRASSQDSARAERLREEVITRCLPLAEHIALRYRGRGEPHEDLLQVARLGLVNAVDRFDLDRGGDFVSFAVPTIMGEVRRYFRDSGWQMRVPRRLKDLNLRVGRAGDKLSQRLGRSPTPSEIAAELDVPLAEVAEGLLARNAYQADSTDATLSGEVDGTALGDLLGREDPELAKVEEFAVLGPLLEELSERDRSVLLLRFFGGMTQTQIAERIGVSQMHVSRILAKTLRRLRVRVGAAD